MAGRPLKAEWDRALAANRDSSSAPKDGVSAVSPVCSPKQAKTPTGERIIFQRKTRKSGKRIQA